MSGMEISNLIQTGELAKDEVADKLVKEAEAHAEEQIETIKEQKSKRKKALIKFGSMAVLAAVVVVFATIAWFAMNRETSTSGMGVKTAGMPFELRTSGPAGLYDDYIDPEYTNDLETGTSGKIKLRLTADNHMENLWNGEGDAPSAEQMRKIKKLESEAYGLSPGDYGQITFTIVPKVSGGFDAKIQPKITCYKTSYDNDGYQNETVIEMDAEDNDEKEAMDFLSGHVLLFYKYDSDDDGVDEMHLIDDSFTVDNITTNENVTIYWVWPNRLNNILELSVEGLDSNANTELRKYFFTKPEIFLAKTGADSSDVFDSITLGNDATAEQVSAKVETMTSPVSAYNSWSARYNSADQIIGDRVGYIMLEINVEPSE